MLFPVRQIVQVVFILWICRKYYSVELHARLIDCDRFFVDPVGPLFEAIVFTFFVYTMSTQYYLMGLLVRTWATNLTSLGHAQGT